ncbi:MAG: hypothetical protein JO047_04240 [Alphaproteobacteria bacterium]|nr:hypothetical protein [Alphaproteobacteria bacterium]
MQISIPGVPDGITGCVVTALAIDVIAALALVSAGALFPGLIALALAIAVYWFVYRNLTEDLVAARAAAVFTTAVHATLAVVWLLTEEPFGFAACGAVAVCLGYALVELIRLGQRAGAGLPPAGAQPVGTIPSASGR